MPLVAHFHGFDAYDRRTVEPLLAQYRKMFSRAKGVVVVSRHMERRLLDLGAPPEQVYYNPYGVDLRQFTCGDPESSPPIFLAVGRFVDKKAPHLTVLAFQEVVRACPDARLLMLGDGYLLESCQQLVSALGLEDKVNFAGARTPGEVADMMRRARAFVQHSITTSYGDSEGTPVAILEAGASGLPVVSTRHGGITDVVIHNETGYLVEERDVGGMAGYMIDLARNPGLAARLGRANRQRVSEVFPMDRSIQNLAAIISHAIDSRR